MANTEPCRGRRQEGAGKGRERRGDTSTGDWNWIPNFLDFRSTLQVGTFFFSLNLYGTVTDGSEMYFHLILSMGLDGRYYYYSHFTNKEAETFERCQEICLWSTTKLVGFSP